MVDKFLKIAGVNNMEDFYKLHPTEEHFFKTYPHAKKQLKRKKIRKAANGGMLTQYEDGTPSVVPANLLPYFEEQMKRQGKVVLTDKGTNMTYYGTKKPDGSWDINSFEVLTGQNPNENAVHGMTVQQLETRPDKRASPIGIFPLKYNKNIYGMPGYNLEGSGSGAYHVTYKGPDDLNRAALYGNNNNEDNYRSYGCINCQKPSIEHLTQFIGNDPHNIMSYTVNSKLSEQENRTWFNSNSPKYIYNAETGQTEKVVPVKKAAPAPAAMDPKRAAAIVNADAFGLNPYKPWYHTDGQNIPGVPNSTHTPMMMLPEKSNPQQIRETPARKVPQAQNNQVLKQGDSKVAQYQQFLNQQMPGVNLTTDGMWGPKTQAAYEAYMANQKGTPLIEHNEYAYGGNTMYATKGKVDPDVAMRLAAEKTLSNRNIPFTFPNGKSKKWNTMTQNEREFVEGQAMKNAGRINSEGNSWYDDINPLNAVMNMAGNLYTAPYETEQSGSYMPWLTAIGEPVATAATLGYLPQIISAVDNVATTSGKKLAQRVAKGKTAPKNTPLLGSGEATAAEEATPVEIIYPKAKPKAGAKGPTVIDITPGGNIVPRTSAVRPARMSTSVGEYVPFGTVAGEPNPVMLPPGPSQPLLLGEGIAQEIGQPLVQRIEKASKLGAFDYLPEVIGDAAALSLLANVLGAEEAKKIPVQQRKKVVEQIKQHNETHPPAQVNNPKVIEQRVLQGQPLQGYYNPGPFHGRGDVELQGQKEYFKNPQEAEAYNDKYLNLQTMKKTQKKYGGKTIRRRSDMMTFAEGGPAPGQYRLFDLPGGFHYDIDANNARYLAGSLFDPSHSTTPAAINKANAPHPAVHAAAHAATMAPGRAAAVSQSFNPLGVNKPTAPMMMLPPDHPQAQKAMYSPEVLAKIKGQAHQLNEQEIADQYRAAHKGTYNPREEMHRLHEQELANEYRSAHNDNVLKNYAYSKAGNPNVAEFQAMLNKQMGTNLAVDGMWGPKTQAAYDAYTRKNNMTSMSPNLEPAMNRLNMASNNAPVMPTTLPNPYSTPAPTAPAASNPMMNIAPQRMGNQFKEDNPMGKNQMAYGGGYYEDGGRLPKEVLRARLESHMSPAEADDYLNSYAAGGGIHIDPSKKGTFKAQATRMGMSVQQAASHILANKEHYSPAMVKKANFAKNFAKAYGGYSFQEGGETMPQEQMEGAPQQMQEQAMGQEQQQGGQDQMMQQLMQMVAQALQQGTPPEQIVQMLVQQGIPQEMALQAVQIVMQQMGGGAPQGGPGQQYQSQGEQYQGPQGGQPQAAYGGYYADGGFFNDSYLPFDY